MERGFIFIGYLKREACVCVCVGGGRGGGSSEPPEPPLDPPLLNKVYNVSFLVVFAIYRIHFFFVFTFL